MSSNSNRARNRLKAAAAAAGLLLPWASLALAEAIDPNRPLVVAVGVPRGAAPSERLDGARTGRSRTRLPARPVEIWSFRTSGGLELPPLVDANGNVIVALSVPDVVKLSADGKEVFRARIGAQAPLSPPLITSSGTVVVLTTGAQAVGLSPAGAVRFTTPLGVKGRDLDTAALALRDGGVVVAAGRTLLELDGDGNVRARAAIDDRIIGALIDGPEGTLVTTESGGVYSFRPPGAPRKLGTFGGAPRRGAALADKRTLLAVVDGRRVVAFDLATGATQIRASVPPGGASLDGPVTIGPTGLTFVATQAGLVLGLDAAGNERVHFQVEKPPIPADAGASLSAGSVPLGALGGSGPGFFPAADLKPSPPLVIDPDGRVAFVRAGGRAGVAAPDGTVTLAADRVCSSPIAVVPAGERRMLVACRDGALYVYGE
jgi:outer membrane protein assembly factor BamB